MKILVVDDSRMYQAMLVSYVEDMGFNAIVAKNGEEALDIFPKEWPELILLDVNMPGIDGYETARQIRNLGEEWAHWVPIIFLSSSIKDKDIVAGIDAGGDDYLAKPVSEIVLHAKIKAMKRMADHRSEAIKVSEALSKANEQLEQLSKIDALTGIGNKRYFNEYLEQEWFRCMRTKSSLSLLFIDVDHFKLYNDNYGHLEGDVCLKKVAQALNNSINRGADMVFRYGGEEFAFILPDTDAHGISYMGEAVLQALRDIKLPHEHSLAADIVTVSVGGTSFIPEKDKKSDLLIQLADRGVYQAKEQGRNRFISINSND